ncbi:MAG TPA: tRNA epoxyqueuosine(34) reductase QueG [Phycisphaerae bacterium]|nr:tRNA epoxyqueuosine(34) reductase QueG [Phycisphaerae bacterium]
MMDALELARVVKGLVMREGFALVGIARAGPSVYGDKYREWIAAGKHGEMGYLAEGVEERVDITRKFPWAKSVVCVGMAYWQESVVSSQESGVSSQKRGGGMGRIARYAWGRDYHKVVEGKLRRVERGLREAMGEQGAGLVARVYCDTGPVLERELAQRAGVGWVGKHTLLIHPRHGSWFVLGELVVSVELAADEAEGDHCGTCRRCIEACPTGAITPYSVDGVKCLSYQTLENRGEIPGELQGAMREAGFIAGCDICQEVCPFNGRPLVATEGDFLRAPVAELAVAEVSAWEEGAWDEATRGRAFRRVKLGMFKRNAGILGGT